MMTGNKFLSTAAASNPQQVHVHAAPSHLQGVHLLCTFVFVKMPALSTDLLRCSDENWTAVWIMCLHWQSSKYVNINCRIVSA